MPKVAKVSIALTPELASVVDQAVDSGDYATGSEVIREALREWKQRRALLARDRDRLRELWEEGLASGPGGLLDIEALKAEGRLRMAKKPGDEA
jgi:antitoxin ParD1/3/4